MQLLDDRLIFSATDLNNYLECGHLVALERRVAANGLARPEKRPAVDLIAQKGLAHEAAYLATLHERFPGGVEEIDATTRDRASIDRAVEATIAAMARGVAVVYQGTFFDGRFLGKSDFLLRVERPCARWAWSYEVVDTKLALKDKPYFIVQLENYSEHLARVQGAPPEHMHVVLGNGRRATHRVADYAAYYRHLKASFLAYGIDRDRYPYPCSHCDVCGWSDACASRRYADDHLSLVAGMRRSQAEALEENGTATLAALGSPGVQRPAGMNAASFARLREQAALQLRGRVEMANLYQLLPQEPATGFELLPPPVPGDVYFDMEGDPLYEIGTGLEYLFGFYTLDDDGTFVPFWGLDRDGEKAAFERAVDFIVERRRRFPDMHVYHYAPYEKTALRKLMQRHGTREDEVDDLLRGEVLVDLYAVVRQSLLVSQPSYSIKKLEAYYGMKRTAETKRGDDSVLQFETWLEHGDDTILDDIATYNAEDCRSTYLLHAWLLERREEYAAAHADREVAYRPLRDRNALCHDEPSETCSKCVLRERERRELEALSADQRVLATRTGDRDAILLSHLMSYHRREEKPVWWALFDRCENVDGLVEFDREAIGGLVLRDDIAPERSDRGRSIYTYAFPEQLHHLRDGGLDPATQKTAGNIVAIDDDALTIRVKRSGTYEAAARLKAIVPGGPVTARTQRDALGRLGRAYLDGTFARRYPAAADLLAGRSPRLHDRARGARIQPAVVSPQSVLEVVRQLDRSVLFLQGPPGTGKTYTGARVVVDLLRDGKRVGVMANSHKAMHNMLHAIEAYASTIGLAPTDVRGLHKHSKSNDGSPYVSKIGVPYVTSADDSSAAATGDFNLISGNAWLFAREDMAERLDYLFIDEAGQIALADALAVMPATANCVLLGDPMQLAQVSTGHHLEDADRSVLEHLLGERATVAPERGILLDVSYRMEPSLCAFVSTTMYDGRVHPGPSARHNRIGSAFATGGGIRYMPVAHAGNGRESAEEALAIARGIDVLLRGTVTLNDAPERPLHQADVLVVTPYNAQRKRIEAALAAAGYPDVRVGTVDKFQGQEAPVVFYSMATSSGEELPRNMEFLFEKNRFNVAISRAQCMSVLVCSPQLLDIRCHTVDQMALVNVVCRYVEDAGIVVEPVPAIR